MVGVGRGNGDPTPTAAQTYERTRCDLATRVAMQADDSWLLPQLHRLPGNQPARLKLRMALRKMLDASYSFHNPFSIANPMFPQVGYINGVQDYPHGRFYFSWNHIEYDQKPYSQFDLVWFAMARDPGPAGVFDRYIPTPYSKGSYYMWFQTDGAPRWYTGLYLAWWTAGPFAGEYCAAGVKELPYGV